MTTTARLTLEQFLALPDTEPASEYACGEVIQKPMPGLTHYVIQHFFDLVLGLFLRQTRLGRVGPELRCIFGPPGRERVFVPDIAFLGWQRLPRGDTRNTLQFRVAPDLAIEILSPNQPMGRFTEKIQFYLLYGVRLVWVVDPAAETVTVLVSGEEPRTLSAGDTLDGGDVLPEFSIAVADIFAEMDLQPSE